MIPCLKQKTRCVIRYDDGTTIKAVNECAADGLTVCPRVTAKSKSGEDYHLCGTNHAEARAAYAAARTIAFEQGLSGTAYLYGHDFLCRECQHALTSVNVRTFVVTGLTWDGHESP